MNDVFPFLNFTIELGEDFHDGKLPSLDTTVWVENGWKILFEFFEKTMATNLMVEAKSALSNEVKMATLSEKTQEFKPGARQSQKAGNSRESVYQDDDKWPL